LAGTSSGERPAHPPRIEVRNLVKTFRRAGGRQITPVDHIDLTVDANELVVLLGPSGCGKTTLLRCVAGLERPDSGEIVIDGRIVFSSEKNIFVPPDRRALSMIFQSFALWPHMTVAGNVAYPLESRGLSAAEIRKRVTEVLDMVGVGGLEEQYPGRISGGQQQRVALARALVSNSTVVLFDEPLSNVDAQVRSQLRFELRRMQQRIGFSALYVTHDQTEAMELGHRVAVLESGRIAALGRPRDIYENPRSEYVANFIGVTNLFPGRIVSSDGRNCRVETALGALDVVLGSDDPAAPTPGTPVSVVIRPEKLSLGGTAPASQTNAVPVRIEARMFAGPHTEYVVSRGDTSVRIWAQSEIDDGFSEGNEAWLSVSPARIKLVPPAATSE